MNIKERASWLAGDFHEGLSLELSDIGLLSMASVLCVQFGNVAKAARKDVYRTALTVGLIAFGLGTFTGVSIWITIFGGW